MASKTAYYVQLAEDTRHQITGSMDGWKGFLTTAARNYKYTYPEQLMIYAQRPEATACAEYDFWNQTMHRFVRRGSKGIGLIDLSGDRPTIRYVFDVSDTGTWTNSRPVNLWDMRDEYNAAVTRALASAFSLKSLAAVRFGDSLDATAACLATAYWDEHKEQVLDIVDDSFLYGYDELNVKVAFQRAVTDSVRYMLYARCVEDAESYFAPEDFADVFSFNTPAALMVLGTAISETSEQALREIERAIRNYERSRQAERKHSHDRTDLHEAGGLPLPEHRPGNGREQAAGQVRQDASGVSSGEQHDPLQSVDSDREAVPAPVGDSGHRGGQSGADHGGTAEDVPDPGQENPSDGVGTAHEQPQGPGRRNRDSGAYHQLSLTDYVTDNSPAADETIQTEAESEMPSAFSITQEDIDAVLRSGSGFEGGKYRIYTLYQQESDPKQRANYLKAEYGNGGRSWHFSRDVSGFVDYSSKGIKLSAYRREGEQLLRWAAVEKAIAALIARGDYLTAEEQENYADVAQRYDGKISLPAARTAFPPISQETVADEITEEPDKLDEIDAAAIREQLAQGTSHAVEAILEEVQRLPKDETPAPERFILIETDDGYAVWDDANDRIYVDEDGITEEFTSEWQAESYLLQLKEAVSRMEAREWRYIEGDRNGVPDNLTERQQRIAEAMELAGLRYVQRDGQQEPTDGLLFENVDGSPVRYLDWNSVYEAIENAELGYDPGLREKVQAVLHPDRWIAPEPPVRRPASKQEIRGPTYQVGDTLFLDDKPFVVERIGLFDVELRDPSQIYPISRTESKERLDGLLQKDGRNAAFLPAAEDTPQASEPQITTTVDAIYPGEKNRLPFDVIVQTLHVDEPEHSQPEPEQAESVQNPAQNFRITDDHLGEGGPKAKFRANIMAIQLLKKCEEENRPATPEEQEILSRFVGWGGLADAFDPDKESWATEYLELKSGLTPEEYAAARGSTLNAHYTTPTVIRAIYDAVKQMGFESGNILEPSMGVGNFFGMLPESMMESHLYGVELDSITGRIAQKLYPQANITVAGFETTDRRDFYDLAVGNVPFGKYRVSDKAYDRLGFKIHNYFFAKALDQVRPGGIVAFVTSRFTMDSKSPDVRKYLAQRADLLGAVRLPNNAFLANAGTDVVSDIIFLQKRERPIDIEPDWVHLGLTPDNIAINSYFTAHPEMVLGTLSTESTQYGRDDVTVEPIAGADLGEQLHEAIAHIEGHYQAAEVTMDDAAEESTKNIPADPNVKNFSYAVVDDEVYFRENSVMKPVELNETAKGRVLGMVALRQIVNDLILYQMEDYPDADIQAKQQELNAAYDAFYEKYGTINSRANALAFSDDSSYYLLCSLENVDEDGKLESKADMFTRRTIRPERRVNHVDTPSEALAICIGERGKVDLPFMAELLGIPDDYTRIITEMQGVLFRDPMEASDTDITVGWHTADDYLSGNVRDKLRVAQMAAKSDDRYAVNVTFLEKAQPKDLDASEIDVRLGATWLEPKYIQQFMLETFETPRRLRHGIKVNYSSLTAEWFITGKTTLSTTDVAAYTTYGTSRANAYRILEDTLNLRDVRIYDTIEGLDGKKRVLNKKETTLAQQKQQAIKDAFRDWIWKDSIRRETLVKKYNELFNSTRPREYDGSHIQFVGMNPEISLREHQRNAIAHVLYGGNTLLAHEVGAGKTFEMAAAAMESKRLGLCQKSMFVVPNHLTLQWASEFLRLYPSAKILVTTKKDFEASRRKKFCARIATGDYDAVIIGHSQFEKIPISPERQERLLREQIDDITDALDELRRSHGEKFTIKQMEKTRKNLQVRLKKITETDRKDDVITFDQLGVDRLFVDESQAYKNRAKRCA